MASVLASNTASDMSAVSDHAYSEIMTPEASIPGEISGIQSTLSAGGAAGKPIWLTEEGMVSDGDGYTLPSVSEPDAAQIYVRDVVTAWTQGVPRFFWFDADVTPTYGATVLYGNYVPRPRLTALAACASLLDGTTYQKSYIPSGANYYAHMFNGTNSNGSCGVCVVWNSVTGMSLNLPIAAGKLQAFDTMGNPITVSGTTSATVQVPTARPTYLQCALSDYSLLDSAVSGMTVTPLSPVTITAVPVAGGVEVTLTGASYNSVEGTVSLVSAQQPAPAGWPAAQHFQSLGLGQSQSFRFSLPATATVSQVQVTAGDLRMQQFTVPYTIR